MSRAIALRMARAGRDRKFTRIGEGLPSAWAAAKVRGLGGPAEPVARRMFKNWIPWR